VPLAIPEDLMDKGVRRLLNAPLTLEDAGAPVSKASPGLVASERHRELFADYVDEVDYVTAVALQWWQQTLTARKAAVEGDPRAERKAWIDRPAGPASYPGLVALIRDYWLACDRLNSEVPESQRVPPWTFLLEWLLDGQYQQCVSVLACMPYWPIGLDEAGHWV
jgi:hypothetical protein